MNVSKGRRDVDGTRIFFFNFIFSSRFLLGRRQPGLHQAVAKVDLVKVNLGTQQVKQLNTTD